MELNKVYNMDCLIGMQDIEDKSVDMILCDLPYQTTANKWDFIVPFEPLWEHIKRVCKDNANIILTSDGIFTAKLIMSNEKWFKYKMVWDKKHTSDFLNAKRRPLRQHEDICVFNNGVGIYNPIMRKGKMREKGNKSKVDSGSGCYGATKDQESKINDDYYPTSIIQVSNANQNDKIHSTQKPTELFEYLIKTYSNENDLILDMTIGSGTTAIACLNTKRNYIGFEMDKDYFDKATKRIKEHKDALDCNVGLFSEELHQQLSLF